MASVWYGVDPLTENYPNVSTYSYCMSNPIRLLDSDGKRPHNWNALYEKGKEIDVEHSITFKYCAYYNKDAYDDRVVNIWMHGQLNYPTDNKYSQAPSLEMGIDSDSPDFGRRKKIDRENVSILVQRLDKEDKGWRKRKVQGHTILVLHSCRAAKLAQELSGTEELKDVVIIAPYTSLKTYKETGERVMDRYDRKTGKVSSGSWNVYLNGKPVLDKNGKPLKYSAMAQPGTKGFDYKLPNSDSTNENNNK